MLTALRRRAARCRTLGVGVSDQQIGGAIMLIVGGISYLAGALWLLTGGLRMADAHGGERPSPVSRQ